MAVPRPLLLALLGTVLLAVTFMATVSSREQATEDVASPALEQQPAPTQPKPQQAGLAPTDAAKAIFSPGKPIDSARFGVRLWSQELGGTRERDAVRLSGSFQAGQAGKLPSFDVRTSEVDAGRPSHSRLVSTGDKGFLFKGDTGYALAARNLQNMTSFRSSLAQDAQSTQLPPLDPSPWLKDLKTEGTVKLDGVKTTHISGTVDPKRTATDVRRIVKAISAASEQPVDIPRRLDVKVRRALQKARLEAWVGTDDRILRRLSLNVTGTFPPEMLEKDDTSRWRAGLDVTLSEVNQPHQVAAPDKTSPRKPARALGAKKADEDSGLFALGALFFDPPASVLHATAGLVESAAQQRAAKKPRAVSRAVARNKRVVIFFKQARGVDDAITDDAVAAVRRRSSAVVFQDSVANVASYGEVVMSVGVTRAPSIVIIGKSGRARLIEGYIDPGALAQIVADTR